jgi:hypothetical protein
MLRNTEFTRTGFSTLTLAAVLGAVALLYRPLPAAAQAPGPDAAVAPAPGAGAGPAAREPRRKDRVFAKDLEGLWLSTAYLKALRETRMPLEAARKTTPIAIKVQKEDRSYPMVRTDFDRAVILRIIDLQPEEKPGAFRVALAADDMSPVNATEVTYVSFRGQKAPGSRFETLAIAEPVFGKKKFLDFQRVDEGLAPLVNGIVIAGSYRDAAGAAYRFSTQGEAQFPGSTFSFEVRLSPKGANCSIIEGPEEGGGATRKRDGFRWKSGVLELYDVEARKADNLKCATRPFVVLTPEADGGSAGSR